MRSVSRSPRRRSSDADIAFVTAFVACVPTALSACGTGRTVVQNLRRDDSHARGFADQRRWGETDVSEMENKSRSPREVGRRAVVKGAAWSMPVIAAASAMPLATASAPACPTCIKAGFPLVGGVVSGAWTSVALVAGNKGTIAFPSIFGLDATACGISWTNIFQPAFTYVVTQATLRMSDGKTYNSTVGLAAGAGNVSTVGAMPGAFVFNNVSLPNGGSVAGIPPYPVVPTTLTVTVTTTLQYGLGLSIQCPTTLVWNLHGLATGLVLLGTGSVNFTGTATV